MNRQVIVDLVCSMIKDMDDEQLEAILIEVKEELANREMIESY